MGVLEHQYGSASSSSKSGSIPRRQPLLLLHEELLDDAKQVMYDPIEGSVSPCKLPELESPVQCIASAYGWLLLLSRKSRCFFFFNPFTHSRINLPYPKFMINSAVFTDPPTSSSCVIYIFYTICLDGSFYRLEIDDLKKENPKWIYWAKTILPVKQAIYSYGHVYCIDSLGKFGHYDIGTRTWTARVVTNMFTILRNAYLVASGGEIFAVTRDPGGEFTGVFKLKFKENDKKGVRLEKVTSLGNFTFFAGPCGSFSTFVKGMENEVCIANYKGDQKCAIYNVEDASKKIVLDVPEYGVDYTPVWILKH
ncbi:F-box protein At4g00893-like [Papaver somniferum]|uniref:F-box protein At4g00893-like n=1 Tax=Papaver somniferum TaxID=3469 RepID=UPI000E7028C4|nr:F-box protein At4g00893-like [Papaver somniferum]